MNKISWNEPLWGHDGAICGNSIVTASKEDVIAFWRYQHFGYVGRSDEEVLDDFMVVNWAWEEKSG